MEENIPTKAGLFQIRVREGLLTYPKGKSAMFYYGYASNLKHGLVKFRKDVLSVLEANEDAFYVRWMPAEDVEERFQNHLKFFLTNFGSMPLGNAMLLQKRKIEH
ncbi:MAG: hypothetical protein ACE5IW_08340 [bacterium]